MLKDLVKKCRSYRRFFQEVSIPYEDLKDMVDTARLTGCTKNCQGLKFKLISTPEECAKVFPSLLWAGALKDWDGPADGERPSAYVLVLEDLSIGKNLMWDEGIVSQSVIVLRWCWLLVSRRKKFVWCRLARMAVQLITGMRIRCIMCRNGRWKIFWFRMFENLGGHRAWPSFCILGRRFLI